MTWRPLPLALLTASLLAGCGAARPAAAPLLKRPATAQARAVDVVPLPTIAPELRIDLTEEGFTRLRRAFSWKEQAPRTDYSFDAWDGQGFRRQAEPGAPKLRVKVKNEKAEWQISRAIDRKVVDRTGLPVELVVTRGWGDALEPTQAAHLLARTQEFFLWLDEGGEPLRQRAREIDLAWRHVRWFGADVFFPTVQAPALEAPAIYPSALKKRHGWRVDIPRDEVGGGLSLFLHFDEVRDADGRWVDTYEVEAEPREALPPEGYEGAAVDFSRALAAVGLTADDLEAPKADATGFTARQLQR